ncbi:MAG: hypothetical protein OXU51_01485 [Candidatus Poribacteria bacterium]|nr:hypothetical protein [Candidatus Poribacteria bacterium]
MSNIENKKNKLQLALLEERGMEDTLEEFTVELRVNLNQLFTTLEGNELVEAVISSTQDFIATELCDITTDEDIDNLDYDEIEGMQETIQNELTEVIARFISDEHREAVVRYHARGLSTTEAVETLITENSIMNRLAQRDALGEKKIKELLIPRLAYLKPGTTRWPEKKYGSVWREERQQYIQEISNTSFSTPAERIALLAKHAARVNYTLDNKEHSVNDLQSLTQSLTKTVESLEKLSPTDQQASMNLSTPQLPSVLERFTVALEAFQQIVYSGDPDAIVEIMEKFTLAMQPPSQQNAITGEVEEKDEENRP